MTDQSKQVQSSTNIESNPMKIEKFTPQRILQIISSVSSSSDLDSALRNFVANLAILFENCQVSVFKPGMLNEYLFFYSSGKQLINLDKYVVKPGEGILGSVIKNLQSFLVEDYSISKDFIPLQAIIKSELVIPFSFQSKFIALLDMASQQANTFSEHDQKSLDSIGSSLGGILSNLIRIQEWNKRDGEEVILRTFDKELSKSITVEETIITAAREISKLPEVSQVAIYINPNAGTKKISTG
jgi:L-methionine (R)-S-oxide reductase